MQVFILKDKKPKANRIHIIDKPGTKRVDVYHLFPPRPIRLLHVTVSTQRQKVADGGDLVAGPRELRGRRERDLSPARGLWRWRRRGCCLHAHTGLVMGSFARWFEHSV